MRLFFLFALVAPLLFASDFQTKEDLAFKAYMKQEKQEFYEYKKALKKAYDTYTKELEVFWQEPKLSSKKSWVHYSNDKKSRFDLDFEKGNISVEVIAKSEEEAQKKIQRQLKYALTKTTQEVMDSDALQKRVAQLKTDKETVNDLVDAQPILTQVYFKDKPKESEVTTLTKKLIQTTRIKRKKSKDKKQKIYALNIKIPKNATLKRSQTYMKEIKKNAQRFSIQEELVFAIMHTESWFNPFAKSHVPAFGLMQIVPASAGRDTYKLLYKRDAKPSAAYLYNSKNNIEMGVSYLYILYYRYLRLIKNPQSRLYCTIAAYNTGAGNIAWAFTRQYSMKKAAPIINALTPQEVYEQLLKKLRFDEPKKYLKNVRKRMYYYKKEYEL